MTGTSRPSSTYARRRASFPATCAARRREIRVAEGDAGHAGQLAVAMIGPHHADDAVSAQIDDARLDPHRHEHVEPAGLDVGHRPAVEMGEEQHELGLGDGEEGRVAQRGADLDGRPRSGDRRR